MSQTQTVNPILTFPQWYYGLPALDIKPAKLQIIEACMLPVATTGYCDILYNWLKGRTEVPPLAREKINAIANQPLNYNIQDFAHKPIIIKQ